MYVHRCAAFDNSFGHRQRCCTLKLGATDSTVHINLVHISYDFNSLPVKKFVFYVLRIEKLRELIYLCSKSIEYYTIVHLYDIYTYILFTCQSFPASEPFAV